MNPLTRVAFIGDRDHAHCAHRTAYALRCAGVESRVTILHPHPFGYDSEPCVDSLGGRDAAMASLVQFLSGSRNPWVFTTGDGSYDLFEEAVDRLLESGIAPRLGALHVGSSFRNRPGYFNQQDRRLGVRLRVVSADSMDLCCPASDGYTVPYLHSLPPRPKPAIRDLGSVLSVAHSPSRRSTKGTDAVIRVVTALIDEGLPLTLNLIEGVSYEECSRLRSKSDVFVGQLNPKIGGFGYSSVEAASEGLVPIASLKNRRTRRRFDWDRFDIPAPPVVHAGSPEELRQVLSDLCASPDLVRSLQDRALAWTSDGSANAQWAGEWYARQLFQKGGRYA